MRRVFFAAILMLVLVFGFAAAEVYVGEEPPADWSSRELMRLYVFPTYQSDCMVLQVGEDTMFIDGARVSWEEKVTDALQRFGFTRVDYLFSSHPHPDHIQNMCRMLQDGHLMGELFITPYPEDTENEYLQEMIGVLQELGIPYYHMETNEEMYMNGATLRVMRWENGHTTNATSGMLHITFGQSSLLLTADVEAEAQGELLKIYGEEALRADVMKTPHHGLLALKAEFLDTVQPSFVFITNSYEKSKSQTGQVSGRGIPLLYNDDGVIIMETDGKDWYIKQLVGWGNEEEDTGKTIW